MNVQRVLFFCLLSALCGGDSLLVSAKPTIYTAAAGGNGTINCFLQRLGIRKFLCKGECKGENILIETDDVKASNGKFSLEYKNKSSKMGIVSVTFTHLTRSDSARYICGLGKSLDSISYIDFDVRVTDALLATDSGFLKTDTVGENVTYSCKEASNRGTMFFCKGKCLKEEDILIETDKSSAQNGRYGIKYLNGSVFGLYVTITQVTKSDTGQYLCGHGRALSPDSYFSFSIIVLDASAASEMSPTLQPFPTSAPSASTATPVVPETTEQPATAGTNGFFFPQLVCVLVAGLLLAAAFLLILYIWKKWKANSRHAELPVTYRRMGPIM